MKEQIKRAIISTGLSVLVLAIAPCAAADRSPTEILAKMDDNMTFKTRTALGKMTTHDGTGGSDERRLRIWARGLTDSYVVFEAPARDKGVKYLKRDDNLYMYLPQTEKVVKISGHMLRQSLMDSDFSYEDMLESPRLLDRYEPTLAGEETVAGEPCWVLQLKAKVDATAYAKRKLWIAKRTFVAMKDERYAESGLLMKVVQQSGVVEHKGRFYPSSTRMEDKLKKGTYTVFELSELAFDGDVPDKLFSRRNLMTGN